MPSRSQPHKLSASVVASNISRFIRFQTIFSAFSCTSSPFCSFALIGIDHRISSFPEGIAVLADLGSPADRWIGPGGGVKGAQMQVFRGAFAWGCLGWGGKYVIFLAVQRCSLIPHQEQRSSRGPIHRRSPRPTRTRARARARCDRNDRGERGIGTCHHGLSARKARARGLSPPAPPVSGRFVFSGRTPPLASKLRRVASAGGLRAWKTCPAPCQGFRRRARTGYCTLLCLRSVGLGSAHRV